MTRACGYLLVVILAASGIAAAQLHSHGGGELQRRPFDLGGYVETKFTHYQLNRDSAFYKVEYAGLPQRSTLDYTSAALRLNGNARADAWQLRFNTLSRLEHDQVGHASTNRFDELAVSWKPRPDFTLDAGKIALKWGKGHPWNPVAFVERPKDSSDPRLSREGYSLISARLSREFSGALQAVTLTPVLLPVTKHLNSGFGKHGHLNVAARLHLDFGETEAALYFLNNGSRARRYGFDFSRDIISNFEAYGEWARISAHDFRLGTPAGASVTRTEAATSYLAGMRYRTPSRQSYLLELHHNGTGYTAQEFQDFITLAGNAAQPGADRTLIQRATRLYAGSFGRQKPMRNYVYVRASRDTLPLTPSIRATVNLQDGSYSVTPELLYSDHRRWGLRARLYFYGGGAGTEYGERYYSQRFELRVHYHF
jgi:hypothetical protein